MGTLTMELGGKVSIDCEKTGYYTEIEFKLKVQSWQTQITANKSDVFFFRHFWVAQNKQIVYLVG